MYLLLLLLFIKFKKKCWWINGCWPKVQRTLIAMFDNTAASDAALQLVVMLVILCIFNDNLMILQTFFPVAPS
jgi:hypothetical protein